jgi:hypothetical protein
MSGSASRPASAATSSHGSKIAFTPCCAPKLAELAHRRGAPARRAAERMEPIVLVIDDPRHGRDRIVGRIEPPHTRRSDLRDVEFRLREP